MRAGKYMDDFIVGPLHQRRPKDCLSRPRLADCPLRGTLRAKARMSAVLIGGGAADIDELSNAGFFRRLDQRDSAAVIDALESETSARVLDRITIELDAIDDRAR